MPPPAAFISEFQPAANLDERAGVGYFCDVTKILIAFLAALLSLNSHAAESNLVEKSAGVSGRVPNPTDPTEKEYLKLLAEDDQAQSDADQWIQESQNATGISSAALPLRIRQRLDPVKKHYDDFLQRHPKHVRAHLAYGSFLNEIGKEEEGVKQWEKARGLDPKNPAAWNNLANYYGHRGPVKKAFEFYAKAIELNPNEPVYYQNFASRVYLLRQDAMEFFGMTETQVFDKALELYRKAMKLAPSDFILASDYAQSFYGTNPPRLQDGLAAWTDVLKIARDEIEREGVRVHLARLNWKLGHFEEAHSQLNAVTNEMYAPIKRSLLRNLDDSEKVGSPTK